MPHGADALEFVPNPAIDISVTTLDFEKAKSSTEHLEDLDDNLTHNDAFVYHEDEGPERARSRSLHLPAGNIS